MARASFVRRHRVGIASGAALTLAATAVVVYAVTAQGYKSHEADLNDGGVWVVNGKKGWSGRMNKPIGELDGVVPSPEGRTRLDVVQDGASVVTLNLDAARGQAIDTAKLESQDGGTAAVPAGADVWMGGGTLASADPESGDVWAVRYDGQVGKPVMSAVDRQADPLVEAGKDAALTVSQEGTVVATSVEDRTVTTAEARGAAFAEPTTTDLPDDAGEVSQVTTVGERVVTLDQAAGTLTVLDGATAAVPAGSELQQPGPDADAVLVTTPEALLSIDLGSGAASVLSSSSGTPVAPVRLGACAFGAWSGGQGSVATACGAAPGEVEPRELGGDATTLAFRVNRGEVVLNDAVSGAVWDVEQDAPVRIDNWESFTSKKKNDEDDDDNQNQTDADRRPPRAEPDSYGVRAGRTTVLHPLDNDSAPQGRLLSIVDVDQPSGGARVEISPDGQSLVLQMPEEARPATFEYFIDDGRNGVSAHAAVDVRVRGEAENAAPTLRAGYEKPTYKVPHGGSLSVPVLSDWRDDSDGDTLLLDSARAVASDDDGASARTTSDGRIRFTAPTAVATGQQLVRVDYAVTDGRGPAVRKSLTFQVQAPNDQDSFPPRAEPDVVRGEAGKPIKIRPLLNDLPGSDPSTPDAELSLGGKVPQPPGTKVVTDVDAGQLTFTGDRPGTYFLSYDAGYGNATLDRGTIRVDVRPRPKRAAEPIAMPDTLTVYGQAAGIVDVLANDLDPAGGLLVVQQAEGDRVGQLDVAIVDGRWLRISARQPSLSPPTQTVSYKISNGTSSARGEVVVTQRPQPADNRPITANDKVVVRAGSAVSVPVLDNDVSPSGDRLTLLNDVADSDTPGELDVVAPIDVTGDVGRAFVSNRVVRYVAPGALAERDTYDVPYVATNQAGERATGHLKVTVVPKDEANNAPEPPTLEGRVVSGDTVKVRLPGVGIDPDGDPVTVTGITSAPRLGRIVSFGGNFLEFQAYPRTVGTDEFSYAVVDSQGAFATGTVRVAVVAPSEPQRPLAVADRLTVEPGRTATFDPLANDYVAAGDSVEVQLVDAPEGVELDPDTNLVTVPAPAAVGDEPVVVVYRVTNGLSESRATMTLDTAEDYNNPPVVYDAFGSALDSGSVVVDVLEGAYDPDGSADDLQVVDVTGDESATVVDDVRVRADRGAAPKVLPFVVRDGDGATATASLYVPPTGSGLPSVVPGAEIKLDVGGTTSATLSDYVTAPDGSQVRLASGARSYSATPSALNAGPDGDQAFEVSASPGFRGPGAVLVEVTTASDDSGNEDASTTEDGATVLLSIPVQVGDDAPVLECPTTVLPMSAGQSYGLDIATFCKVFTVDPRQAAELDYSADWDQSLDGVEVGAATGSVVQVTADDSATRGGEAVLEVRAGDSNTQQVRFRLAQAPSPTLLPIQVDTLEAGQSRTYDVRSYLQAGVADPEPTIVSVESTGNSAVRASADGSRLTLTAAKDARGVRAGFRLVVSDVGGGDPPPERTAETKIDFEVIGTPSAPSEPHVYQRFDEVGTVKMSWRPPGDDGGAPVLYYNVREEKSGDVQRCDTVECTYRGLKTGGSYNFRAQAVNRVGPSDWSDLSRSAKVDTRPGRVSNIRMAKRADHAITIAWDKPPAGPSRVQTYTVTWQGGSQVVDGASTRMTAAVADNNRTYTFTVVATNKVGVSDPRTSAAFQSLGQPAPPAAPVVTDLEAGSNQTSVRIEWQGVLPEGPGPTLYSVNFSSGGGSRPVPGCQRTTSLSCTQAGVPYDGTTYTYTVVASNQPVGETGNKSLPSAGTAFEAVGRPAAWGAFQVRGTGTSQEAEISYTVPDSRGEVSKVDILVAGTAVKSFAKQTGDYTTRIVTPGNEQAYPVQLRVCNERAPVGCTLSGVQNVQTYGRLDGMLNEIPDAVVNGKTLTWTVSGSSNGDPAQVLYRINGGPEQAIAQPGVGGFTQSISFTASDWAQDVRLDVRLVDSSPAGRGEARASRTSKSGVPVPGVGVQKRADCNDGDEDGSNQCAPGVQPGDPPPCDIASCGFIRFTANGFYEPFTCRVNMGWTGFSGWQTYSFEATGSRTIEVDTDWYAPSGGGATVTCQGTGFWQRTSSGGQPW